LLQQKKVIITISRENVVFMQIIDLGIGILVCLGKNLLLCRILYKSFFRLGKTNRQDKDPDFSSLHSCKSKNWAHFDVSLKCIYIPTFFLKNCDSHGTDDNFSTVTFDSFCAIPFHWFASVSFRVLWCIRQQINT
jgi:hypothetical protein